MRNKIHAVGVALHQLRAAVTSAPEVRKQGCRAHLTGKDTADHNSWEASLKSHREHTGDTTGETHTWSSPPTFGFSGKYHQRLIINSTDYSPRRQVL